MDQVIDWLQAIPLERVQAEARDAALQYADINDACPYPFQSDAGHAFKAEFRRARAALQQSKEIPS
jgi:hypothetical protein